MPGYGAAVQDAIAQGREVELDFDQMTPEDQSEAIEAINLTHSGDLAQEIRTSASRGIRKFRYNFSKIPRSTPLQERSAIRDLLGAALRPIESLKQIPLDEGVPGVTAPTTIEDFIAGMRGGAADAAQAVREIVNTPDASGVPDPVYGQIMAPAPGTEGALAPSTVSSQPFMEGVMGAPPLSFDPTMEAQRRADMEREARTDPLEMLAALPLELAASTAEQTISPFGLATLPVPKIGSVGGAAARLAGKAMLPLSEATIQPIMKGIGETAIGSMFMTPQPLRDLNYTLRRKIASDTHEIVEDLGPRLMANMTPEESALAFQGFEEAAAIRETQLNTMKRLADSMDPSLPLESRAQALMVTLRPNEAVLPPMVESTLASAATPVAKMVGLEREVALSQEVWLQALVDQGLYKDVALARQGLEEAAALKAKTLKEFAVNLPRDVDHAISREARRRGFQLLPHQAEQLSSEIAERFGGLSDRYVAARAAGDETFASFDRVYLPRFYLEKEIPLEESLAKAVKLPRVRGQRLKGRELTTEQAIERDVMQDIRTPAIKGLLQEHYDVDFAEYFQGIAQTADLASPVPRGQNWQPLLGKKYGALHGMFVHPSVQHEIKHLYTVKSDMEKAFDRVADAWKRGVTIYNPPVIVGNTGSSLIQNDLGGLAPWEMGVYREALKDFREKGPMWHKAKGLAIVGNNEMRTQETTDLLQHAAKAYADSRDGISANLDLSMRLMTAPEKSRWTPGMLYRNIEDFMKFALYYKATTRGIAEWGIEKGDDIAAARHALHFGIDNQDVPLAVRSVRTGIPALTVGAPFITYSWKITPILLEAMLKQPQKFAKYGIAYDGWNRAAFQALGMSQEEFDEWRRLRSQDSVGVANDLNAMAPYIVLPRRDALGNPMAVGMARFTPWGQAFSPRGLNPLGMGPGVASLMGAGFGMSPQGRRLFDPSADDSFGGIPLSPSIGARRVSAGVQPFVPPLLTRSVLAGAEMAGPEFDPLRGATNVPGAIQELLGRRGGMTQSGTPVTVPRQVLQALFGNVESMNLPAERQKQTREKMKKMQATSGQLSSDMLFRMLGEKARQEANP